MQCPKCGGEAGSGRFCRSCGTPVATGGGAAQASSTCPSCGTAVKAGAKFCSGCAAPLGAAPVTPPAAAATTICVNCGAAAAADTKFCKSCGKPVGSGAPAVAPVVASDLAPTAVLTARVRAVAPPPPSLPVPPVVEPARAAQSPVPRVEAVPQPKLVAKPDLARPVAPAKAPGGSNATLIIAMVAVVVLAAAGLVYKFVLHKPAAVVESPATSPLPPPTASTEASPAANAENADTQPAAGSNAQQPADTAANDGATEGKRSPSGGTTPAPVQKRSPAKASGPGYAQAHANAEQALAASEYINPPDASALFWARKAKALGDPAAGQIEQQVFTRLMADVSAARQSHLYDQAQAQVYQLASSFPEHTELRQLQDDIHQEQQHYTQQQEEQRRQAELQAQIKKFAVQHRHGTGGTFCTGLITVTPDGVAKYDCNTADSGGRCEHVVFQTGSLKEVKVRGDGSMHVATRQQGNFDFIGGEFAIKDAAASLGTLVNR